MCIDLTCWQWVLLISDELDDANRQHDGWHNAKVEAQHALLNALLTAGF